MKAENLCRSLRRMDKDPFKIHGGRFSAGFRFSEGDHSWVFTFYEKRRTYNPEQLNRKFRVVTSTITSHICNTIIQLAKKQSTG